MKLFILGSLLIGMMALMYVDLGIQKNRLVREKVMSQAEIQELVERQQRLQAEIRMELADPELEVYFVSNMDFNRDFNSTKKAAKELAQGRKDTRRVDNEDETGVSRP